MNKAGLLTVTILTLVVAFGVLIFQNNEIRPIKTVAHEEALTIVTVTESENTTNTQAIHIDDSLVLENTLSQFEFARPSELQAMTTSELQFYLADFRFSRKDSTTFADEETELIMNVFEFAPEIAIDYFTEYFRPTDTAQQNYPKVVKTLLNEKTEADLKDGFYRYIDAFQKLPTDWYLTMALQSEMYAYFEEGNTETLPSEVSQYALEGLLDGDISQYSLAVALNPTSTITREQLVQIFLDTSAHSEISSLNELLFDIAQLNDPRTYNHLLEFMVHQPKKLNIYRNLSSNPDIPVDEKVSEVMADFSSLNEQDKTYFSLMALNTGNKVALSYLLKNSTRNYTGPVDVNIEFVLKRIIAKPANVTDTIRWAQEHANQLTYNPETQKFSL